MDRADMIKYAMYAAVAAAVVALVWWFTNRPKRVGFKTVDAAPVEEVGIQPVENEAYSEEEEEEDYDEEDDEDEEEDYEEEYEEPAKADDDYDDAASVDSD